MIYFKIILFLVQRPAVPGEGEPVQGHLEGHLRGAGPAGERKGEYEVIYPSSLSGKVLIGSRCPMCRRAGLRKSF